MAEYLAPGVYVEEIDAGPKPIEGVSTSTVGMVGMTVRGPVDGLPKLVTSFADFKRKFGGYLVDSTLSGHTYLPYAVRGFFENGGKRLYIKRVSNSATTADTSGAGDPPTGGLVTRLNQNAVGGTDTIRLLTLRGIQNGVQLTLEQNKNGATTSETVTVGEYSATNNAVTLTGNLTNSYEAQYTSVTTDHAGATPLVLAAADPGAWGNDIKVQVSHTSIAAAEVTGVVDSDSDTNFEVVQLTTTNGFYVGAIVEFDKGVQNKLYRKVQAINGSSITLTNHLGSVATVLDPDAGATKTMARTCEFQLVINYDDITEVFTNLSLDSNTNNYYRTVINESSVLVRVTSNEDNTTDDFTTQPSAVDGRNLALAGGGNGSAPGSSIYLGQDNGPGNRTGIEALADIDEISIVAVPGQTGQVVQNGLIAHCEAWQDRFAILDPTYSANSALEDIQTQRNLYDTKYAALYFPNIVAYDPITDGDITLPPSGHIAGIYAQTDIERGVHKAPANVVVSSITGLDLTINKAEQDILNPVNINVIRDFRKSGRGYRVWGARCLTSDASWKYVPVRRLFIFVEESLDEGLQWVVFEPNDEPLWARVRQSISNFLTRVWRDGALMGTTVEEAFFVRCDATTMTQDDIDNGRLIVQVGIAPVKPAEFVIIRISQFTLEANA